MVKWQSPTPATRGSVRATRVETERDRDDNDEGNRNNDGQCIQDGHYKNTAFPLI